MLFRSFSTTRFAFLQHRRHFSNIVFQTRVFEIFTLKKHYKSSQLTAKTVLIPPKRRTPEITAHDTLLLLQKIQGKDSCAPICIQRSRQLHRQFSQYRAAWTCENIFYNKMAASALVAVWIVILT